MAQWLSWLERRPVTAEVESSSLFWVVYFKNAAVAELADAQDLKSCGTYTPVPVRFRSAAVVEREKRLDDSVSLIFYFKILVFPYEFKR